ncbi:MAG: hypothetical protein ACXVEE_23285 [Polyangiales bacterium]
MKVWSRRLGLAAAIVALLPLLLAFFDELFRRTFHHPLGGDYALLELGVRRAMKGTQLVGPYSRFVWSHPGPLYFYVVAPFYVLNGQASATLHLVASILAAGGAITAFYLGARMIASPLHRAFGLLIFAWLFHSLLFYSPLGTWAPNDPWNPRVTVMPFFAFFFLAAYVSRPKTRGISALVLLHAFITQTHLGSVPLATVIMAASLAMRWMRSKRRSREVAIVALTAACAWALPVIEDLRGHPGNFTTLTRFFASDRDLNPVLYTVGYTVERVVRWHIHGISIRNGLNLLVAVEIALLLSIRRTLRRRPDAARFATLAALALPTAFAASTRIHAELFPHITPLYPLLLPLAVFAIGWCLLPQLASPASPALALLVLLPLARKDRNTLATRSALEARHVPEEELDGRDFAAKLAPLLRAAPDVRLTAEGDVWATQAALVLGLEKASVSPLLDPRWTYQYGPARYSGKTPVELVLHDKELSDALLVFKGRLSSISLRRPPRMFGRASVRASEGVTGDPAIVVDGISAVGSSFDAPTSLQLSATGSITLDLHPSDDGRRDPIGVYVTADHNDTYRIEGSHDGLTFRELGFLVMAHDGDGMRGRQFIFPASFSTVRISPGRGDGLYAISEVTPIYGPSAVDRIAFGQPNARERLLSGFGINEHDQEGPFVWAIGTTARCELHLEEGRGCTARLEIEPLEVAGRSQTLTIEIGETKLATLSLVPEVSNYSFELPANLAHPRTELTFRFAYATAPHDIIPGSRDKRALAAQLRLLEVCPGAFTADDLR